jgi:DNA (cytosine-5)-methyltransferase 1
LRHSIKKGGNKSPLKALDLCAGIGGFRAAIMQGDLKRRIEFVGHSDIDPYAIRAYSTLYDINGEYSGGDIQQITRNGSLESATSFLPVTTALSRRIESTLPACDLLCAGFPCQPHSLMGNRQGAKDLRGALIYDLLAIVEVLSPAYVILENVRAIKSVNYGDLYEDIVEALQRFGYSVRVWMLNASDYGTPQTRRRIFFVAAKQELPDEPPPQIAPCDRLYLSTWHLLERNVDSRYYLSKKILGTILKHEHKGYKRKAEINKMIARPLCKTMHKMHRASQDNYFSDGFINGCFNEDTFTVSLAECGEEHIRRVTPREALRIQSFPESLIDRLIDSGLSDTRLYMLAGNAVPPVVVNCILNHII